MLMQTSPNQLEIQQIHRFMQHAKSSLLDLQFVLLVKTLYAKNIQKTLIFVNIVAEVISFVKAIRKWMILLHYLEGLEKWMKRYFLIISELDKAIVAEAFQIDGNININRIIFVTTNAYGIGINNLDIRLVIE